LPVDTYKIAKRAEREYDDEKAAKRRSDNAAIPGHLEDQDGEEVVSNHEGMGSEQVSDTEYESEEGGQIFHAKHDLGHNGESSSGGKGRKK